MAKDEIIKREEEERQKTIETEKKRKQHIKDSLMKTASDIDKEIYSFYSKYSTKNGISISEAKRRVANNDVQAFMQKARELVQSKDFSEEASAQLDLYNTTMKINRLEFLKSEIGILLVDEYQDLQSYFQNSLDDTARQEFKRQAGILGGTILHLDEKVVEAVTKPFEGMTWNKRLWSHEALLSADIGGILTSGFITGKHPRELAKKLRERMEISVEDANILMITEMSRVQTEAQKATFQEFGYEKYEFIAERDNRVCAKCHGMDGQIYLVEAMEPGVNAPPMHARCRCSTSAIY